MTKKIDLIYKLDGTIDGIDLFELSPILLSVGQLIKRSNDIVNPLGKDIGINVKPFEKGSFIIDLVLFAHNNAQELISLVNNNDVRQLKELLEWLGIISGGLTGGTVGLLKLLKWLKGSPNNIENLQNGDIRLTNSDNNTITVNKNVYALYSNNEIKKLVSNSFERPFQQTCIEKIDCYIKDEINDTKVEISKDDISDIGKSIDTETGDETKIVESEDILTIVKAVFDKSRKWEFEWMGIKISAIISDDIFFKKLSSREIGIKQGDSIKAKMRIRKKLDVLTQAYMNDSYEILEVTQYIENFSHQNELKDK